jgi:ribosome-associated protein
MMAKHGLNIGYGVTIPDSELTEKVSLSGGPGGQHANKTSSRVTLNWNVVESDALGPNQRARLMSKIGGRLTKAGVLQINVDTHRSQHANRETARERLAEVVHAALVIEKRRKATKPTRGSQKRRVESKRKRSEVKKGRGKVKE